MVKYLRGYDNPCPDLFRIIIQHFKCKPDQTGGSCVCHAEAAGNRVVGEGAQAPEDAEAPLQQTQQQYQASAREMADMARDIQTYFDSENLDAVVSNSENAVYIRFKNDLLFAPDNANLTDASKSMLDAVGIMLKEKQDNILAIYINGHTAQAANSLINDRLLSSERADNVAIYLEEQVGIPPKKLICRGYGKYYPIADNTTREGREQNRRVDMIILGTGYKPPDTVQGMETMDPLFPVTMPGDETMMQEGTASD